MYTHSLHDRRLYSCMCVLPPCVGHACKELVKGHVWPRAGRRVTGGG
jgi:hypothetical protein